MTFSQLLNLTDCAPKKLRRPPNVRSLLILSAHVLARLGFLFVCAQRLVLFTVASVRLPARIRAAVVFRITSTKRRKTSPCGHRARSKKHHRPPPLCVRYRPSAYTKPRRPFAESRLRLSGKFLLREKAACRDYTTFIRTFLSLSFLSLFLFL